MLDKLKNTKFKFRARFPSDIGDYYIFDWENVFGVKGQYGVMVKDFWNGNISEED